MDAAEAKRIEKMAEQPKSFVIDGAQAENYLNRGYEFVTVLPSR